jgi:hypothetical protein
MIKTSFNNHKNSLFSSMVTTNSFVLESSRPKFVVVEPNNKTGRSSKFLEKFSKPSPHDGADTTEMTMMSKFSCRNTIHLSWPKLNFSMEKIKSDSDLNRSFKSRRNRLEQATGGEVSNKYNLIFELNTSSVNRSNSSLIELNGFEKSKFRLKQMKRLKNALIGIECEMDRLLKNTNDQQPHQAGVGVSRPTKSLLAKSSFSSASTISTTNNVNKIKSISVLPAAAAGTVTVNKSNQLVPTTSIATTTTTTSKEKMTKKFKKKLLKSNEIDKNKQSKEERKMPPCASSSFQRPSVNLESNISSLICDGDSSSLNNFKMKITNIMFGRGGGSSSEANALRKKSYETFTTVTSLAAAENKETAKNNNNNNNDSIYSHSKQPFSQKNSLFASKMSSDYVLRSSSLYASDSTYLRNLPRITLKSNKANNERKALRVLIIIFSIFVIFWSPFFVINLLSIYCFESCKFISYELVLAITWLGYASSTLNPIIYTMFNKNFRKAFINLLKCQTVPTRELRRDRFLVYKNVNYEHSKKR